MTTRIITAICLRQNIIYVSPYVSTGPTADGHTAKHL